MAENKAIHDFTKLQKIQLTSNSIGYGPWPDPDEEVEQRLTITANGRIWLSRYRFGSVRGKYELIEKLSYSISKDTVKEIMVAVGEFFSGENEIHDVTDVGMWIIALTDTDGRIFETYGPLCYDLQTEAGGLSEIIRSKLGRSDLFVFDGNRDTVIRIEVQYRRILKTVYQSIDNTPSESVMDHKETLIIDSTSGILEHIRELSPNFKETRTCYAPGLIPRLLDYIDVDAFCDIEGEPPDVIDNPLETTEYVMTLYTTRGDVRKIAGSYDKQDLPPVWSYFISDVQDFMTRYGFGEIFDSRFYGRSKRRMSDYRYCNVTFEDGGQTYCYIADSDDYNEGDLVVVPAGSDNHEAVVRIESIEYYSAEEAPFPVEKTKHILRKYVSEDEDGIAYGQSSAWREQLHDYDLIAAHHAATFNKDALTHDSKCGCFYCLRIFSPSEINEWCPEERDGEEVTALCPYCGIDSVLGEGSGFPITPEFLQRMKRYWFDE